jgi:SAM-dependent methyltransferase
MTQTLSSYPCPVCGSAPAETRYTIGGFRIVACRSCGMIYVNPRIRNEELFALYKNGYFDHGGESGYEDYELIAPLRIKTFGKWYHICKQYLPPDFSAALDIGCAAGYFLDLLIKEGWRHAEGIELDSRMIAGLRRRSLTVADAPLEQFVPSKRYHLITLFDVLEHLPDINDDFAKLHSMLDDKGIIALVTPNFASMQRKVFGRRWFQFKPREHIYYFTPQTLRRLAGKHGFEIVRLSNSGQFADYDFLHNRLAKYRFPLFGGLFAAVCAAFRLRKKFWHVDTGSMFAVLKKKSPQA